MNNIITKTELTNELAHKHVAIYADNLSKDDCKSVAAFMKQMTDTYAINDCVGKTGIKNVLHDRLLFYEKLAPTPDETGCLFAEFTNLVMCDEVWVFDNGYDNYNRQGRLDTRLSNLQKPVRFLAKTPDGNWEFYQGRITVLEDEDLIDRYYLVADSIEWEQPDPDAKPLRPLSKQVLSEIEYDTAFTALLLTQKAGCIDLRGMVRNDEKLSESVIGIIKTGNEIVFGILGNDSCDEEQLKTYRMQLEFAEAELDEIREKM